MQNPLEQLSIEQLRQRTSAKWHYYPADVLPMWVAEMDVPLAEPIAQGLRHAVEIGDTGYAAGHAYAHALKDFAAARWGWDGFPADSAKSVPDVMMGIVEVLRLISEPGDPVVVNCPVYPPFYAFVTHAGRRVVESPMTEEGRIDLHRLEDTFRALNRAVYLLSSPHNPTGAVHTREELTAVAGLARTYGVRVIVDEIHAPLALPGAQFVPYLSVPGSEDAFSVLSASKAWNLAGLKAALAVAGPEAQSDLDSMPEEVAHGASHFGVMAHTEAFRHGGDWLDALLRGLDENRSLLIDFLTDRMPELQCRAPQGTYLAWIDCRALGLHDEGSAGPGVVSELEGPARYFLDQARVALSSGHVFGTGGSGHVRLNFATSQANLLEGLERMATALTRLPGVRH
ncbi:MAG: MalY/PatB family protein [Candidatus Nanopelagicales bacterium]